MKRVSLIFVVVVVGLAIPLLGDGAKKDAPLDKPLEGDAATTVTERAYPLPDRQADVLALLLRIYPPLGTDARTEPKDDRLALVVKGPARVHEAVGKFVEFLNAEEVAKTDEQTRRARENGRKQFIIKPKAK